MAEEIEEQQEIPVAQPLVEKKSRGSLWFSIIISICIIVLAGAGFYLLQQLREQQDTLSNQGNLKLIEISKQMNGFQSQLAAMQTQIATFESDLASKESHFNNALEEFTKLQDTKLDSTRKQLRLSIKQLQRQLGKTRGDWLIADAEYLLSVANQRLHLVGDIKTAREALVAADQRLRESGDAAVFKVREQIAQELAALKTVKSPDIVGLYFSLGSLKDKVPKLAVFLPYADKPRTTSKNVHNHTLPSDQDHGVMGSIAHQLEGYITIRHSDKSVKEVITPEQAQFIQDQLGIKIEMIKLALVQQDDTLYKSSIADAKHWLIDNFTQNSAAKNFADQLDKLSNSHFRAQLPDISHSLKMLRDVTRLRIEHDKGMMNTGTAK